MRVENGKARKITVNGNVDLLVREVRIIEGERTIEAVELREFLKNAEVEGHGLFIPKETRHDVIEALQQVWNTPTKKALLQ
jgi:hypothetical protein